MVLYSFTFIAMAIVRLVYTCFCVFFRVIHSKVTANFMNKWCKWLKRNIRLSVTVVLHNNLAIYPARAKHSNRLNKVFEKW